MKFIIKIYICRNNLKFIVFLRSHHMISKYGNYIPSVKKVIFFPNLRESYKPVADSMGPWQAGQWWNPFKNRKLQHNCPKVVVSWWSHHMIFHKMDIIGQSLVVYYDGNINPNALQFCTGLQNTWDIMPNRAENKFE